MNEKRRSYTTQQLADALGVSVQSVKRWIDAGHVKAWKTLGGHRKIDADSADAFIRVMKAHGQPQPLESTDSSSAGQPSVLIVDDNPIYLEILKDIVRRALPGAQIGTASNGFIALQELAQTSPDILITDLLMPHVDGVEMLRHLAAQGKLPRQVIVTSVVSAEELRRRGGLPAGIVFVAKPLDEEALTARLRGG